MGCCKKPLEHDVASLYVAPWLQVQGIQRSRGAEGCLRGPGFPMVCPCMQDEVAQVAGMDGATTFVAELAFCVVGDYFHRPQRKTGSLHALRRQLSSVIRPVHSLVPVGPPGFSCLNFPSLVDSDHSFCLPSVVSPHLLLSVLPFPPRICNVPVLCAPGPPCFSFAVYLLLLF